MPEEKNVLNELLKLELVQRREEGCDVSGLEEKISGAGDDKERERIYKKLMCLRIKKDFPYKEPSDFKRILHKRPSRCKDTLKVKLSREELFDRIYGAWLGRCAGCALGKPVEGWSEEQIRVFLENANVYPLDYYFPEKSTDKEGKEIKVLSSGSTRENIRFMEVDDDINYTVAGLVMSAIGREKGRELSTEAVGQFWLSSLPFSHTFTAERAAYANMVNQIPIEEVPVYHNPFREWIGAQIRADFWGYIYPGRPRLAAELAFRDASLSHTKNGIYGEMFVAAMISAAFTTNNVEDVIRLGAGQIPKTSRLSEAIEDVLKWSKENNLWKGTFDRIMQKYGHYHPIHTINNACMVLLGLLYGNGDFEKTISIAVMAGLDTDCNGATAGSVFGAMTGAAALPKKWIEPLNDTLSSTIISSRESFFRARISELAKRTLELI